MLVVLCQIFLLLVFQNISSPAHIQVSVFHILEILCFQCSQTSQGLSFDFSQIPSVWIARNMTQGKV